MENFTPRVMRGWELDYPHAKKLNPNVIMVSCSGYGPHGPYAQYPAQATTQEATHGLVHVTGYRGDVNRPRPASPLSIFSPPGRWSWAPR